MAGPSAQYCEIIGGPWVSAACGMGDPDGKSTLTFSVPVSKSDELPNVAINFAFQITSQVSFVNCHGFLLQLWLRSRSKEGR